MAEEPKKVAQPPVVGMAASPDLATLRKLAPNAPQSSRGFSPPIPPWLPSSPYWQPPSWVPNRLIPQVRKSLLVRILVSSPVPIISALWVISTLAVVLKFLEGGTSEFADPSLRDLLLFWMFVFGWAYYCLEKTKFKLVFGVIEIVAGLASNYAQLGKFATQGTQGAVYDRLALIAGGVIVLAKGIKDVMKGYEKYKQNPEGQKAVLANDSNDA